MVTASLVEKVSVAEFLAMPESEEHMELVDGEIIVSPYPRFSHQQVLFKLGQLLLNAVGNCGYVAGEKEMIVPSSDGGSQVRGPDLVYISPQRADIVSEGAIRGGADIVVEVLSKSTQEIDRITKREEYRAADVREYWIVDMEGRKVLIHDFEAGEKHLHEAGDSFASRVLRGLDLPCEFAVDEIFSVLH